MSLHTNGRVSISLLAVVLAAGHAAAADTGGSTNNRWIRSQVAAPQLRPGAAMVTLSNGQMLVVGGSMDSAEDKAAPGVQAFDLASGKWAAMAEPKPPLLPIYRAAHDTGGKRAYCLSQTMTPTGNACMPQGVLHVLDLGSNSWTRHEPDPALADLDWMTMAIDPAQRKLAIVGADKRPGMNGWSRTLIYDIAAGKYSPLTQPDEKVVADHQALLAGREEMIGLIGRTRLAWFRDPGGAGTEAERKELGDRVRIIAEMPGMNPYRKELAEYGTLLGEKKTLDALKLARGVLRRLELDAEARYPVPPSRQNSPLVYDAKNKVFILFGGDHQDYLTNDTWILDLAKGWRRATPELAPSPRAGHALVYLRAGGRVLFLGGYVQRSTTDYDNSAQNSYESVRPHQAWTYDVAADRWKLLTTWSAERDEKQGPWPCGRFYSYVARYSPPVVQADARDRVWLIGREAIWSMNVDPATAADDATTRKLSRPANQRQYREGAYLASYCEVADPPKDTGLDKLPANAFVRVPDPPRNACFGARSRVWGTAVWDADRDEIIVWGGGHCVRSENPPIHYSPASGRMVEGYDAQEAYSFGGAYGTTTTGGPWVPGHSWNTYAYDLVSKLLVAGWGHLYDPSRMDWLVDAAFTQPFANGYINILEASPRGVVAWGRAGSWNSDRCGLWLFDASKRQWSELVKPGPDSPAPLADSCGMACDTKRDRMLLMQTPWGLPGDGTLIRLNLSDKRLEKLTPANIELGKFARAREVVYVEHADWMLFGVPYVDSDEPGKRQLVRAYDCAANRWMLLDIDGFPDGHLLSHGWVYDAARKLAYVVDVNNWRVWALRLDPKTVKVVTDAPTPKADAGAAEALAAAASKISPGAAAGPVEIIPPGEKIAADHPRLLLRPKGSPHAIGLDQLKALKRDADFTKALNTLKGENSAASQAMVWLLTGDEAAVDKAIARINNFDRVPPDSAFDVWFGLRELALAYDWLCSHPKFTPDLKAKIRNMAFILVDKWGVPQGDDHVFHNYTWMNNCGLALWALASYGDDPRSESLLKVVRYRLNGRMFPGMQFLNGLPGDAMGYWYIYCWGSAVWTVMATQSAFDIDAVGPIRDRQGDWFARELDGTIQGTMPDMRFMPWGDMQSGPDGGVTHEVAGPADAATWAIKSPHGTFFSQWLAGKRGIERFRRETAILYFLYTRQLAAPPAEPPLAMLTGGPNGGQAMMRSAWKDDATVVGFRCTDYYQGHYHYDVGSFVVYRNGLLAVDAGRYTLYTKEARGPVAATTAHNTLLLGGKGQREVTGQWYKDLAALGEAMKDKRDDRRLERGDIPFYKHVDGPAGWTAVAGQFAQAYAPGVVDSCVRQLLFVRPNSVVVVDHLVAAAGKKVPEVTWMLHVPATQPETGRGSAVVSNPKSWLRCRDLLSDAVPTVVPSQVTQITGSDKERTAVSRFDFVCPEQAGPVTLVHLIEVGDGQPGAAAAAPAPKITDDAIELTVAGKTFTFARKSPFTVAIK